MKGKKYYQIGIIICISLLWCVSVQASEVTENNTDDIMIEYNVKTGEVREINMSELEDATELSTESFVPEDMPIKEGLAKDLPTPRDIIGSDDRIIVDSTRSFPMSATGYITNSFSKRGTAWLFAPQYIATAAHCLVDNGEITTSATFSPGRAGDSLPWGQSAVEIDTIMVPQSYLLSESLEGDYAIARLSSPLGDSCGYFGIQNIIPDMGSYLEIYGYPSHIPGQDEENDPQTRIQCIGWGNIVGYNTNDRLVYYDCDTLGGMSGGPMAYYTNGNFVSIGIHTQGISANGSRYNSGVRLYSNVYNLMYNIANK